MQCPKCQHDNPPQSKFCFECGAEMELACPKCGISLPTGVKFCNECGHDLSQPEPPSQTPSPEHSAPTGERRQATVLFSDLSGYTAMNEKLDPEEVEGIMSRIKAEAVKIVESHGGIVSQFVGDEVLALFGIPTAHEDDPRRAVRAALELHELARDMSPEVEQKIGRPLRMHTGIDAGLVVTSNRDVRDGTVGVTGDTVNTGARLVNQADEDEIVVSPETQRLIRDFFATEALEPVAMKGKAKPLIPYRVVGESGVQTRFEAAEQRGFTPYTGRDQELETLHACLEKAVGGQGQCVTVSGEAGLGKSRLFYEFRHSLDRDKVTVLQGRCQSYGAYTPYLPLADTLRRGLELSEEDSPETSLEKAVANVRAIDPALERYIPLYLHLLSLSSEAYPLSPEHQGQNLRLALQEAYAAIVLQTVARKPMALILEDWHWADEASDTALKYLLGLIAPHPLLVVVNYRPEYVAGWGTVAGHSRLDLAPLKATHSMIIARDVLGAERLPEGLGELIHERTGGNPFFIEEMCHDLLEEGTVLVKEGQAALTRSPEKLSLPTTVHAVIRSRVDRLDSEHREVLRTASVIGREFDQNLLERALRKQMSVSPLLDTLKAVGLIQQVRVLPEVSYLFKHVLTQVVVYETLLLERRRALHSLVGHAMEELFADRMEEHYEQLAYHFHNSHETEKAVHYLELAGRKAVRGFSFTEGRLQFRDAVILLDAMEPSTEMQAKRIELTLRWSNCSQSEPSQELLAALEAALQIAENLGDKRFLVRITRHTGWISMAFGKIDPLLSLFHRSLEMARNLGDEYQIAMATEMLGRAYWHINNYSSSLENLDKSRRLLEQLGTQRELSYNHTYSGQSLAYLGNFHEAQRHLDQSLQLARAIDDVGCELLAHDILAWIASERGDWEEVTRLVPLYLANAERVGFPMQESRGKFLSGMVSFYLGDPENGVALMRDGLEIIKQVNTPNMIQPQFGHLAYSLACLGRWHEAEATAEEAMAYDHETNVGRVYLHWTWALTAAGSTPPNWEQAEKHMRDAIALAERLEYRPGLSRSNFHFAELLHKKGDLDHAQEQLDKATALFGEMEMAWWLEQAEALGKSLRDRSVDIGTRS